MAKALIIHRPAGGESDWHFIPTLGFLWNQLKNQQKKKQKNNHLKIHLSTKIKLSSKLFKRAFFWCIKG